MQRPLSYQATQGTTTRGHYAYDKVSRLVSAAVANDRFGGGILRTQDYTLDSFSNIQAITGNTADPGRSSPTNTATNRLTAGTYDNAGRLTAWNGNSYVYDDLGMKTRSA